MNNRDLLQKIQTLVQQERRIGVEVLELLQEIEDRKAYSDLGYDGLFSFCVKELRYSEAQAYRRIQAMRALRQRPELREQIESGRLTVTTVSHVQTYLTQESRKGTPLTPVDASALFRQSEGQTAREVESNIQQIQGTATRPKLQVELDAELSASWTRAKELAAHRTRGEDAALLRMLLKEWLARNDPEQKPAAPSVRRTSSFPGKSTSDLKNRSDPNQALPGSRVSIPAGLRRQVWQRDHGRCQNCGSRYAIQVDHIQPVTKGGKSELENLRLLCRSCNLAAGIRVFGPQAMRRAG